MRCIILNRFYMLKMFVREFVCIPLEHRTMAGQKVALINIEPILTNKGYFSIIWTKYRLVLLFHI